MPRQSSMLFVALAFLVGTSLLAQVSDEANRIQSHVFGVDSHNGALQRVLLEGVDLGKRLPDGSVDLPRLREGGMHVPFFALVCSHGQLASEFQVHSSNSEGCGRVLENPC